MGASGGTTIFFSPPLYFTVSVRPSTPATVCSTLALVMVLWGRRSQGRCPSPVPRIASGKICTSTAFWLPSACGIPVTPTNEPGLTSESDALAIPTTGALSGNATLTSLPSRDLTNNVWPSTPSIVPRTRTVSCAHVAEAAKTSTKPATVAARRISLCMSPSRNLFIEIIRHETRNHVPRQLRGQKLGDAGSHAPTRSAEIQPKAQGRTPVSRRSVSEGSGGHANAGRVHFTSS